MGASICRAARHLSTTLPPTQQPLPPCSTGFARPPAWLRLQLQLLQQRPALRPAQLQPLHHSPSRPRHLHLAARRGSLQAVKQPAPHNHPVPLGWRHVLLHQGRPSVQLRWGSRSPTRPRQLSNWRRGRGWGSGKGWELEHQGQHLVYQHVGRLL